MRCPHCQSSCRYIGDQAGAEKYYGSRMQLWTCKTCGTTLSKLIPLETSVDVATMVAAESAQESSSAHTRPASAKSR